MKRAFLFYVLLIISCNHTETNNKLVMNAFSTEIPNGWIIKIAGEDGAEFINRDSKDESVFVSIKVRRNDNHIPTDDSWKLMRPVLIANGRNLEDITSEFSGVKWKSLKIQESVKDVIFIKTVYFCANENWRYLIQVNHKSGEEKKVKPCVDLVKSSFSFI